MHIHLFQHRLGTDEPHIERLEEHEYALLTALILHVFSNAPAPLLVQWLCWIHPYHERAVPLLLRAVRHLEVQTKLRYGKAQPALLGTNEHGLTGEEVALQRCIDLPSFFNIIVQHKPMVLHLDLCCSDGQLVAPLHLYA